MTRNYDDDDIVLVQTCGMRGCCSQVDLEFDVEEGEYFCALCRELSARAETEGFGVMLNSEEKQLVGLIFDAFAKGGSQWGPEVFAAFAEAVAAHSAFLDSDGSMDSLERYFSEEFDIHISGGVACKDLECMYGGYKYNNMATLDDDIDALSEVGLVRTGLLE